jgi:broad specificity phosphatase PhoE
MIAQTCL